MTDIQVLLESVGLPPLHVQLLPNRFQFAVLRRHLVLELEELLLAAQVLDLVEMFAEFSLHPLSAAFFFLQFLLQDCDGRLVVCLP